MSEVLEIWVAVLATIGASTLAYWAGRLWIWGRHQMSLTKEDYRHAFKWEASLLWARGMPPPTADEIADAMTEAVERLESDDPFYMGRRKKSSMEGTYTPDDSMGVPGYHYDPPDTHE